MGYGLCVLESGAGALVQWSPGRLSAMPRAVRVRCERHHRRRIPFCSAFCLVRRSAWDNGRPDGYVRVRAKSSPLATF